ncbi:MAG: tetratricopeptide repeat protein [Bacteroidetes bacterium]|nr:tetratricopeptide repeat protein [Bacteroidota bacterium]
MKINGIHILIFLMLIATQLVGQSEKKLVREGNNLYEEGNYQEAEIEYRKALSEKPDYVKGKFNLGDAMYGQENYEESGKIFGELGETAKTPSAKSGSWYNLGNTLMNQQKYQESIEAYKKALRVNPNDQDAKYNLEYARKMLSNQQQQQQNQDQNQDQDQKDQNEDQENQDQNQKDQDQKDQEQNQDQKDQKDQQQDQKDQGDQQQQQNQPQPQQISKEDAQRMLDALKNDEKKTLQELQEQKAKATKSKKSEIDW